MSLPFTYTAGLSPAAARRQAALIAASAAAYKGQGVVADRPRVTDDATPRSRHVIEFRRRYGYPITDTARIRRDFPDTDVDQILRKGAGAYASSGSRPNVSIAQWTRARLASVLTGGPALKVDASAVGPISMAKIRG